MKRESPISIQHVTRPVVFVFAFVALALTSACDHPTTVRVVQDGVPVAGAEVFANNSRIGVTDSSGVLVFPRQLPEGTLVARKQVFEIPGYRQNHGPENGGLSWIERVYVTSLNVRDTGALDTAVVPNPAGEQVLELRTDNTLIGLHFLVSVVWDASQDELQEVDAKFRQAGDYIYNATDGQIYFEQIDIVDDSTFWRDADYHYHADINVWPNTWSLRGLFVPNVFGSAVSVSRNTNFQTIAHEFGHLGFGLLDEYMPGDAFCATQVRSGIRSPSSFFTPTPDPLFGAGMPKASCVMDRQMETSKYCSNNSSNPHRPGSLETANCWSVIASGFADTRTPARWTIKTPDTRGVIVGPLSANASALWQPRITIDNRTGPGTTSLCQPFDVMARWPDGNPAAHWAVTLEVRGRTIEEGLTDSSGVTRVVGAHPGDRIWVGSCCGPWRTVIATPSAGPNTCGAP